MDFKSYICLSCGWVYHENDGLPEEGIAAGTRWENIPDDWRCPHCGDKKSDFNVVEF
ncbi:rubredoxin [Variovorax sp. OAS795]|uniref:rubredoxin n=1 Tax=Variovorax sp. OAS795 TaxID=3034231 RepID=UPI0033931A94